MSDREPYGEKELIGRIGAGEQAAFEILFQEWYAGLVVFAENYKVGRSQAEEIVSDAFMAFWKVRTNFEGRGQIKNWLYVTIRNGCLMAIRSGKRKEKREQLAGAGLPLTDEDQAGIIEAELLVLIMEEIRQLPHKYREVLLLTYQEGLSTREISARLGLSVTNVTSRRSRGIQQLKLALTNKYPIFIYCSFLLERFFQKLN